MVGSWWLRRSSPARVHVSRARLSCTLKAEPLHAPPTAGASSSDDEPDVDDAPAAASPPGQEDVDTIAEVQLDAQPFAYNTRMQQRTHAATTLLASVQRQVGAGGQQQGAAAAPVCQAVVGERIDLRTHKVWLVQVDVQTTRRRLAVYMDSQLDHIKCLGV